jgi:hypothetical protein
MKDGRTGHSGLTERPIPNGLNVIVAEGASLLNRVFLAFPACYTPPPTTWRLCRRTPVGAQFENNRMDLAPLDVSE